MSRSQISQPRPLRQTLPALAQEWRQRFAAAAGDHEFELGVQADALAQLKEICPQIKVLDETALVAGIAKACVNDNPLGGLAQIIAAVDDPAAPSHETSSWDVKVAEREWIVRDWLPAGCVCLLAGVGGSGKSRLALQLAVHLCLGRKVWLPGELSLKLDVESGSPVMYASWEDDIPEARRRVKAICNQLEIDAQRLNGRLHFSLEDSAFWSFPQSPQAPGEATLRLEALMDRVTSERCRLVILDPAAAAFGGNENNRQQVRAFLGRLGRWAADAKVSVLIISHPSKPTAAGKQLYSGSTDWWAASRAVWSLAHTDYQTEDGDKLQAPTLQLVKSNYGRPWPHTPELYLVSEFPRWRSGSLLAAAESV